MKKLLFAIAIISAIGCSKDSSDSCQDWEVNEKCTALTSGVVCSGDVSGKRISVCGSDLTQARAGNTIEIRNDGNVKITRTFVKKL